MIDSPNPRIPLGSNNTTESEVLPEPVDTGPDITLPVGSLLPKEPITGIGDNQPTPTLPTNPLPCDPCNQTAFVLEWITSNRNWLIEDRINVIDNSLNQFLQALTQLYESHVVNVETSLGMFFDELHTNYDNRINNIENSIVNMYQTINTYFNTSLSSPTSYVQSLLEMLAQNDIKLTSIVETQNSINQNLITHANEVNDEPVINLDITTNVQGSSAVATATATAESLSTSGATGIANSNSFSTLTMYFVVTGSSINGIPVLEVITQNPDIAFPPGAIAGPFFSSTVAQETINFLNQQSTLTQYLANNVSLMSSSDLRNYVNQHCGDIQINTGGNQKDDSTPQGTGLGDSELDDSLDAETEFHRVTHASGHHDAVDFAQLYDFTIHDTRWYGNEIKTMYDFIKEGRPKPKKEREYVDGDVG